MSWSAMKSRITASVRTTNRMNAILCDTMANKRKTLQKQMTIGQDASGSAAGAAASGAEAGDQGKEKMRNELQYFHRNFNMEKIYKLIELSIEERLAWDRFSRMYDSWRSLQMAETLAADIRDRVKKLNYRRHRIVCVASVVERQNQGLSNRMGYLMNEKLDNYASYVYERPTYFLVVTVFLVYKD